MKTFPLSVEAIFTVVLFGSFASYLYFGWPNPFRTLVSEHEPFFKSLSKKHYRKIGIVVIACYHVGVVSIFAEVLSFWYPYLRPIYLWSLEVLGIRTTQLLVGLSVFPIGVGAFLFKRRTQVTYGVVEVVFALTAAIVASRQMTPNKDWSGPIATLVGAIYIVSRGLGNISDGNARDTHQKARLSEILGLPKASPES